MNESQKKVYDQFINILWAYQTERYRNNLHNPYTLKTYDESDERYLDIVVEVSSEDFSKIACVTIRYDCQLQLDDNEPNFLYGKGKINSVVVVKCTLSSSDLFLINRLERIPFKEMF